MHKDWPIECLKEKRRQQNENDSYLAVNAVEGVQYEEEDMPLVCTKQTLHSKFDVCKLIAELEILACI